jgi:hypothetical protein
MLSNNNNVTPAESNILPVNVYPDAVIPTISFEEASICSNSQKGAILNLSSLVEGQSYELFKYSDAEDKEGAKVPGQEVKVCIDATQPISYNIAANLENAGRYFVKTYTATCPNTIISSSYATLEIIDASSLNIDIKPTSASTNPWMPVKLKVTATGDYTVETIPGDAVMKKSGDTYTIKLPLPADHVTDGDGNIDFEEITYTVKASLITTGGANSCLEPATSDIQLVPYIEPCTQE